MEMEWSRLITIFNTEMFITASFYLEQCQSASFNDKIMQDVKKTAILVTLQATTISRSGIIV